MAKIFSVALNQLRLVARSRSTLMMALGMPIIFSLVFGSIIVAAFNAGGEGGSAHPVAVVDYDESFASRQLVTALAEAGPLEVRAAEESALRKLFSDRKIVAAVIIPEGFARSLEESKPQDVKVMFDPGYSMRMAVEPVIQREVTRTGGDYLLAVRLAGGSADEQALRQAFDRVQAEREAAAIQVSHEQLRKRESKGDEMKAVLGQTLLGFTVMFVMMIVFMQGGTILQEREEGTWGRLLTTPTSRLQLVAGYVLAFFLTGMIQFGLLLALTSLIYGVNWGQPLPLTAMAAAFVLCSAGLGLFVAGVVRTSAQQRTVGTLIVIATSMLGGVYWPLDMVGETMRRIGYLTPQAWAMDGFREVMLRGGSFEGLLWPLGVLLALSVIFMGVGLLRVRYE